MPHLDKLISTFKNNSTSVWCTHAEWCNRWLYGASCFMLRSDENNSDVNNGSNASNHKAVSSQSRACRSISTRIPWGPSRISLKNERSATHTIGDTSTPARGGITLRVAASSGSVGVKVSDHGNCLPSCDPGVPPGTWNQAGAPAPETM